MPCFVDVTGRPGLFSCEMEEGGGKELRRGTVVEI